MLNIHREQIVSKNIKEVFEFFEKPENLSVITPNWIKFRIMTKSPLEMKTGAEFDYRIYLMGVPLKWKTVIAKYEPPYKFVDIQKKGPYKLWVHTHTFEAIENGTKITDNIDYELYGGPVGNLINSLYVKHNLKAIFNFRKNKINHLLN